MLGDHWLINKKILLFTWVLREKWFKQKGFIFHGIEESVIRFSVWRKENELHRKYKVFGWSTENAKALPNLEIGKIDASIGFSTTQSVGNYPKSSFTFQNKFYIIFWISCKKNFKKRSYKLKKKMNRLLRDNSKYSLHSSSKWT